MNITKRQQELLDFITRFIKEEKQAPSYREIQKHFNFSSLGSVVKHISQLKKKKFLTSEKHCPRSLALQPPQEENSPTTFSLPLVGTLSGTKAIQTLATPQEMTIPPSPLSNPENSYLLKVEDDSFREANILSGDFLIVEARPTVEEGSIIIALVENKHALIKRLHHEETGPSLHSIYANHPPIFFDSEKLSILGVVRGLYRPL